ncbi:MAG: hypothetical protein M1820_005167 [Bogoriella megaspora]|nr:MAG: hypothetical protein M1820_005167 [Bogoriella megaspora]
MYKSKMHTFKRMTLDTIPSRYPLMKEKLTPGPEPPSEATHVTSPTSKQRNWRVRIIAAVSIIALYILWLGNWPFWMSGGDHGIIKNQKSQKLAWEVVDPASPECLYDNLGLRDTFMGELREMIDWPYPLNMYGATGRRSVMIQRILKIATRLDSECRTFPAQSMTERVEHAIAQNYPFLHSLSATGAPTAWRKLKQRFQPDSRGIVITVDKTNFRYAVHLLSNLRNVIKTSLPIEVAYAGTDSIGSKQLELLKEVNPDAEFLDILGVFEDRFLNISGSADAFWTLKPFAVLASKFEHVVGLDPDVVLLQQPEKLLNSAGYTWRGISIFQDPFVGEEDRHDFLEWTRVQKKWEPYFADMDKPWKSDTSPLIDGGMVAIDKSRFPVLLGLLQACWLSMKEVREQKMDRNNHWKEEVWMLGPELTWTDYYMYPEYGMILSDDAISKASGEHCGMKLGHVDDKGALFWYGGGMPKIKGSKPTELYVPTRAIDSDWWIKTIESDGSGVICANRTMSVENEKIDSAEASLLKQLSQDAEQLDSRYERYFDASGTSTPTPSSSTGLGEKKTQAFVS